MPAATSAPITSEAEAQLAHRYTAECGLPYKLPATYARTDPERAKRIAAAYEEMEHDQRDPAVEAAHAELAEVPIAHDEAGIRSLINLG